MTKYAVLILAYFLTGCTDCIKLAELQRKDQCLLIVEKRPAFNDPYFNFVGKNLITGAPCDCESGTSYRWWNLYRDEIDVGDTIIKKKGELIFSIVKKDTVITHYWECEGRIYK